jgi:cytochrome b subunit of formate dehydrogenase/nitrate/TMAO reductase-like tetraheme cytochrome c subunit
LALAGALCIAAPLRAADDDAAASEDTTEEEAITSEDCLDCHGDSDLTREVNGKEIPLAAVSMEQIENSAHGTLDCVDCHSTVKDLDHDSPLPPVDCGSCHEDEADEYKDSIHGASHQLGDSGAAQCKDCHGTHNILPADDPKSKVFKLNLPQTCATCHTNKQITEEYHLKYPEVASQFMDSIHGRALLKMGLIVAPSCNDCHGVHDIKRSVDRDSPISHAKVAETCGKCHVGVEDTYNKSIHGKALAEGKENAPTCVDCHTAHEIEPPLEGSFKRHSDEKCGSCHEDYYRDYQDTYHGKAMALGSPNKAPDVAACYDCHGHHDILPVDDPNSRLSSEHILGTCRQCHPNANAGFTKYVAHANPLDGEQYPLLHGVFLFMTALLIGVFVFFGAHTLLWLSGSIYVYRHDSKRFREIKEQTLKDKEQFTRFQPFERFLHFLVVTSFLLLVITGMPLKFYYTGWAKTLFDLIGGVEVARKLHHFGAIITFLYFGLHLASVIYRAWKGRKKIFNPDTGRFEMKRFWNVIFGPDSMVPSLQDVRDFVAHARWFFGKGERPQFDRWTYWEKFDYFAVFWGVAIIGTSGLIMWFPSFFTQFLPGWVINIALLIHSDEALLAAGFIFTIHFFNTHFRPEKFPMDTVIFSGRVSKTEMLHERKRWYDRLVAEGRLDDYRVRDEWDRWKGIARTFGYLFFGTGVVLVFLIIYAMITRLGH